MKISIEKHNFAPELNKIFLRGVELNPSDKNNHWLKRSTLNDSKPATIKDVRLKYFRQVKFGHYATINVIYPVGKYSHLNREYCGYIENYSHLKIFLNKIKATCRGGLLLDGSKLPVAKIDLKIELIG